jgi:uncharacterized protein YkwD
MIRLPVPESADYSHAASWLTAALLLFASCASHAAQAPLTTQAVEERVLALTNELRAQNALPPLQAESRLDDTARSFAGYLASTGKLEHDADGATPAERVKKRGYDYCIVAENLAYEYSSGGYTADGLARNFLEGWSQSPTHRANMLEPEITQVGIGVARSAKGGEYYAVQVFGRPMTQMVKFRVTNRTSATVRYDYRKRTIALAPKQARNHESCVAGELHVDTAAQDAVARPKDGGRYAIVEVAQGVYRVTEE